MSMDLVSAGEKNSHFHLTGLGWDRVLSLAHQYGWEPRGTRPGAPAYMYCMTEAEEKELDQNWNGNYVTNDGEIVTPEDAAAMAAALEKALDDIPEHNAARHKEMTLAESMAEQGCPPDRIAQMNPAVANMLIIRGVETMNNFEFFSGQTKDVLIRFIAFCREGAFEIW